MKVEYYSKKRFKINYKDPIIGPTKDMSQIEYWEERLTYLDKDFAVCYDNQKEKTYYYVYVKGSKL